MPSDREQALLAAALNLPDTEARSAYLEQACGADQALRERIQARLAAHTPESAPSDAPLDQPAKVVLIERPGDRIGRYRLIDQIGEGGCGVVYRAEQEEPVRRMVALKIIRLGMDTRQMVTRFEAERQALAMMDHPNIAKVLDAGATASGRPYFVMELVRGISLTKLCDEQSLTLRERIELFIKVCQAIQHAHQRGIIHRDIKPSNILVSLNDGKPEPKVIDFGIAKLLDQNLGHGTQITTHHAFVGTPAYMSPEQADSGGLDVDTRADIYSLGMVLYEILTGRPPIDREEFQHAGPIKIRRLICDVDPPRPSTRLTALSAAALAEIAGKRRVNIGQLKTIVRGDVDWIVMKCLEKDRKRRYETANGLAADLQRYLNQEPIAAHPPGTAYVIGKLIQKHKLAVAAGAAVVVALVLGVAASTWQAIVARRAKAEAETAALAARRSERLTDTARLRAQNLLSFIFTDLVEQLNDTAQMATLQGLSENAVAYYEGLPNDLRTRETRTGYALAVASVGRVLDARHEAQKARTQLERARKICEELEMSGPLTPFMRVAFGNISVALAIKFYNDARYFDALPIVEHAEKLLEPALTDPEWGGWAQRTLTDVLFWKGTCMMDGGRPSSALPEFQRAVASAEEAERRPPQPRRAGFRVALVKSEYSYCLYQASRCDEARIMAEEARARLREYVEQEPNLVRGKFWITVADWSIRGDARRRWQFPEFLSTIQEEQGICSDLMKGESGFEYSLLNLAWTWFDADLGRFGYDWLRGDFAAAEADSKKAVDLLTSDRTVLPVLYATVLARYHWAQVCAATGRAEETERRLAEASLVRQRLEQEGAKNAATNVLRWAWIQDARRRVEFARLNWPAARLNAEEVLKTLASPTGEKVNDTLRSDAQEGAYQHLIRAALESGEYAAARRALDELAARPHPTVQEVDLQQRFDVVGNQLTRILVLARSKEGETARTELARIWPEVESVFNAGPEQHFNQVQMARALLIRAEMETTEPAARRQWLERAAGYLRPAAAAGRLTRYEREVLLGGIEKTLALAGNAAP